MKLRVLILEDRPSDAELAVAYLVRAGMNVQDLRVDSVLGFEVALIEFAPHVVLCDHGIPGFAVLEALRQVKAADPRVAFIVLSGVLDLPSAVSCLKAGADDIVLKGAMGRLAPAVQGAIELRRNLAALSPRQFEVLRLIVDGRTTRQIAEDLGLSLKTVETHRTEMMKRLDIHDVAGLVRYATRVRLISPEG